MLLVLPPRWKPVSLLGLGLLLLSGLHSLLLPAPLQRAAVWVLLSRSLWSRCTEHMTGKRTHTVRFRPPMFTHNAALTSPSEKGKLAHLDGCCVYL